MPTRYQLDKVLANRIRGGYEGENHSEYTIPSCGLEDVDKAVFNLYNKDLPFFYDLNGERKKIPVIFATGERFAVLRRKKPLTDKNDALILPLISIVRNSIDQVPSKGMSNNQMLPFVFKRKLSSKDLEYRQLNNFEELDNVDIKKKDIFKKNTNINSQQGANIHEVIEIPPPKYFGVTYEITFWASFTQQMNDMLGIMMNAYTNNPGQQFKIESDKGYWFTAFVDSTLNQANNYSDFQDTERFTKYTLNLQATGYVIAPDIKGGKRSLRSFISAPDISFDVSSFPIDLEPQQVSIVDPSAANFDDLRTEDDYLPGQAIGQQEEQTRQLLKGQDKSKAFVANKAKSQEDFVGNRGSEYQGERKQFLTRSDGTKVAITIRNQNASKGETIYTGDMAQIFENISSE